MTDEGQKRILTSVESCSHGFHHYLTTVLKKAEHVAEQDDGVALTVVELRRELGSRVATFDCGENLDLGHQSTSEVVDEQRILLEREFAMDDPPVKMIHLWENLCETLSPGDTVTITGIDNILPDQYKAALEDYLEQYHRKTLITHR